MKKRKAFTVTYEDNHLIIVNKSSGVLVQGDKTGDEHLIEKVRAFLKKSMINQEMCFVKPYIDLIAQ